MPLTTFQSVLVVHDIHLRDVPLATFQSVLVANDIRIRSDQGNQCGRSAGSNASPARLPPNGHVLFRLLAHQQQIVPTSNR